MSIRNKLITTFSIMFVLLLSVSGYSWYALNLEKEAQQDMTICY